MDQGRLVHHRRAACDHGVVVCGHHHDPVAIEDDGLHRRVDAYLPRARQHADRDGVLEPEKASPNVSPTTSGTDTA